MMRLRAVAEQTKIELSRRARAVVRIDEIAYGARGAPLNLHIEITRDEFVKEVSDLVDRTFPVCTEALALANLTVDRIADVILVGGTTKIPYVRDQVGRYFGKLPRADVNPEDAVAAGAALQATALERILSRRNSSIKSGQQATAINDTSEHSEVTAVTNDLLELADPVTGATMAPSELTLTTRPKRPTAAYPTGPVRTAAEPKPDTSYSVTRAGVRDKVADPERYPSAPAGPAAQSAIPTPIPHSPTAPTSFESRTPAIPTQPLARITRPTPAVAPTTPVSMPIPAVPPPTPVSMPIPRVPASKHTPPPIPTVARTVFGTAPAPAIPTELDVDMDSAGVTAADPLPVVQPPVLPTSRQTPRSAQSVLSTAQMPTVQRAPHTPHVPLPSVPPPFRGEVLDDDWSTTDSSAGTNPAAWLIEPTDVLPSGGAPSVTQPLAPARPISPPTEPTMVATEPDYPPASARGPNAQTLIAAPATTARGFQAPQSFPIQPEMPLRPPAKPTAPPARAPMPAPIVLEVTPRGLGIATVAGFCEELIRRNARVPTETKKLFTTSRDQQDLVRIVVCQGESRRLENNTVIGDLILQNLPRRPRGETSIEVTFSLDASGVLHVRARDAQTGVEQRASLFLVGDVAQEDVAQSRDRLQQLRR